MKFIKALIFILAVQVAAFADTETQIEANLMGLGMAPELSVQIADYLGGSTSATRTNNTYIKWRNAAGSVDIDAIKVDGSDDLIINSDSGDVIKLQIGGDANRLFTFNASSDAAHTLTFGDAGVTATQSLTIQSSTPDGDDDSYVCLASGSACSRAGGGYAIFNGNELASVGGNVEIGTGASDSDTIDFAQGSSGAVVARIDGTGLSLPVSGDTLSLQEATAGAKCMGSATANGTTAVTVATTCAATGARIFLTRSSAPSGTAICWQTNIVNGTSFDLDCSGAETGTFDWFIIKESA